MNRPAPILTKARVLTLVTSMLVALGAGTNYVFSAYAPQLAARLKISHTQLNVVALAGNFGVYSTGPGWGRLADKRGPKIPIFSAGVLLFLGYMGIRLLYVLGVADDEIFPTWKMCALVVLGMMTGAGSNGGLTGAMNATAKSFPDRRRATATGVVISGFGLSAFFFSTIAHVIFPGDTSSFLLVLSIGTALPMVFGFFLVRIVPYQDKHLFSVEAAGSSSNPSPTQDGSRTPLLADEDTEGTSVRLTPSRSRSFPQEDTSALSLAQASSQHLYDNEPVDIHGKKMFLDPDYIVLFILFSALSGTGLMYINNIGSIAQVLYAHGNDNYDEAAAAQLQATQVSVISVFNFSGRVLIGLLSDHVKTKLHRQRSYCLIIVAFGFLLSQITASFVTQEEDLWKASLILGISYGGMFGLLPTVIFEWFGSGHFSENWGFLSLAPVIGGNILSLAFGENLDAHEPKDDGLLSIRSGVGAHSDCKLGRECYVDTLHLTTGLCAVALGMSVWTAYRDQKKRGVRAEGHTRVT